MDQEKLRAQVQLLAQSAAFLVLLVYVAGFLVVSIHHAMFGIVQFALLRARILSAGILFAVFFAVAIFPGARIFGLFGYEEWSPLGPTAGATGGRRFVFRWLNFFLTALAFSLVMRGFFDDYVHWTTAGLFLLLFAGLAGWMGGLQVDRRPKVSVVVGLIAIFLIVVFLHRVGDLGLWVLLTWFTWIGLMAQFINPVVREPGKIRHVRWDVWVGSAVSTVSLFAILLYPQMRPALGGGLPVAVTMQFFDKSPIDSSSRSQVWLIDETELGFYVLTARHQGKAVFLPRNLVSAVFFGETPPDPKAAQPNAGTRSGQPQPNATPEKTK
jgi:hypothetical protein